jgi:hypothetical protein
VILFGLARGRWVFSSLDLKHLWLLTLSVSGVLGLVWLSAALHVVCNEIVLKQLDSPGFQAGFRPKA